MTTPPIRSEMTVSYALGDGPHETTGNMTIL
jgi:hypothetical protein